MNGRRKRIEAEVGRIYHRHSLVQNKPESSPGVPGTGWLSKRKFVAGQSVVPVEKLAIQDGHGAIGRGMQILPGGADDTPVGGDPEVAQTIVDDGVSGSQRNSLRQCHPVEDSIPPAPQPRVADPHPHRAVGVGLQAQDLSRR